MPIPIFCPAPFHSIRVDLQDGVQTFRPCCAYRNQTAPAEILENYLTGTELFTLQRHFREGTDVWPPGCGKCQQQEIYGQESLRHYYLRKFGTSTRRITRLEILPSNVCNLRCVMCDAEHSTGVGAEQKTLGWIHSYREIDLGDSCQEIIDALPDIDTVSFIGGEFFLAKRNLEILDLAVRRNLAVELTTNATVILSQHLDSLKRLQKLELQISIDGLEQAYEFVRYPAKWDQFQDNIQILRTDLPQASFVFIFVVQPITLQHMIPVIDYCNRKRTPVNLHDLVTPSWLSWEVLTSWEAQLLAQELEQQLQKFTLSSSQVRLVKKYQKKLSLLQTSPENRSKFVQRLRDQISYRRLTVQQVRQQFGVLQTLAEAVLTPCDEKQ